MNTSKPSVLILHNVVSPYRLPVFEAVNEKATIEVWFCKTKTADRRWDTNLSGYSYKRRVLASFQLGPVFFNPTILWRLLRTTYDIYLVGDFPETAPSTFATILIAKLKRRPVILWSETVNHDVNYFQDLTVSTKLRHRILRNVFTVLVTAYRRALLALPDRYVALSGLAREFLLAQGIQPSLIDHGIQVMPSQLLPEPTVTKAANPYAGSVMLLYFGYLNRTKNVESLIQSMQQLSNPRLRLVIAGSGPDESRLRALAANDPRIVFTGYISDPVDRANLMHWADLFILPTLVDCWALVVNESLYYGTPVVVSDAAGAAQLVAQSGAGVVVPSGDTAALSQALRHLVEDGSAIKQLHSRTATLRQVVANITLGAQPIMQAIAKIGGTK